MDEQSVISCLLFQVSLFFVLAADVFFFSRGTRIIYTTS